MVLCWLEASCSNCQESGMEVGDRNRFESSRFESMFNYTALLPVHI